MHATADVEKNARKPSRVVEHQVSFLTAKYQGPKKWWWLEDLEGQLAVAGRRKRWEAEVPEGRLTKMDGKWNEKRKRRAREGWLTTMERELNRRRVR